MLLAVLLTIVAEAKSEHQCTLNSRATHIEMTQRFDSFTSSWFFTLKAESVTTESVKVFVSVYDEAGERRTIYDPRLARFETRTFERGGVIGGPNNGRVGNVRWVACTVKNADDFRCSDYCKYPR